MNTVWHGFEVNVDEDAIRRFVARQHGCTPEDVIIIRTGGCTIARPKTKEEKENKDGRE